MGLVWLRLLGSLGSENIWHSPNVNHTSGDEPELSHALHVSRIF